MRGKDFSLFRDNGIDRITPAYAGKSKKKCIHSDLLGDHPRLCGEKPDNEFDEEYFEGSPPPMRGKGGGVSYENFAKRITPAYAGKRLFCVSRSVIVADHPRLCGEKYKYIKVTIHMVGSPPPMRGKGGRCWFRMTQNEDHPRLCGEKSGYVEILEGNLGSPPPMRGKD